MIKTKGVQGQQQIVARMRHIASRIPDALTDQQVENHLVERIKKRFESEVGPDGKPWSREYAQPPRGRKSWPERKRAKGYRNKVLQATGALLESIGVVRRNAGSFATGTGLGFSIGVDPSAVGYRGIPVIVYARLHHFGLDRQTKRPFLGTSTDDLTSVRRFVARRANRIIAGGTK